MGDIAIRIEHLGKQYRIGQKAPYMTFRDAITNTVIAPFKQITRESRTSDESHKFWALKDISLDVEKGEVIGIIGCNGAGKSTLLKILSRITEPTEGYAKIFGSVGSLLEVGTGFHPELTGRENIYLSGAILGMKKAEIENKFDMIVKFADVEKFIDTPLKHYSSGMQVRLGFSVAAHLEPEILIVDEVLAVGDAAFQKKCLGKMSNVAKEGRTILFVSHNMAAIQNLCNKGIVLNAGRNVFTGDIDSSIKRYMDTNFSNQIKQNLKDRIDRTGNGLAKIVAFWLEDTQGNIIDSCITGNDAIFCFKCSCNKQINNVEFAFSVHTYTGEPLFRCSTRTLSFEIDSMSGEKVIKCFVHNMPLIPGSYFCNFIMLSSGDVVDYMNNAAEFNVIEGDFFGTGILDMHSPILVKHDWEI